MPDREKVIKQIDAEIEIAKMVNKDYTTVDLDVLESALALLKEQEAETGHWVEQQINSYTRSTTCSVCGGSAPFVFVSADRYGRYGCGKDELTKYCPNCGAEMKGETEVEID